MNESISPPPPSPRPPASAPRRHLGFRAGIDYLLVVPTYLLCLAHIPVLLALPRMLGRHLNERSPFRGQHFEMDLLWAVSLALLGSCLWMLARWKRSGLTFFGRVGWSLLLLLAMLAYPAAIIAAGAINVPLHWGH